MCVFWFVVVNFVNFQQCKVMFIFFWRMNFIGNGVISVEVEMVDLVGGYVDVVRVGEVGVVCGVEEFKFILQYFQYVVVKDIFVIF